LDPDLPWDSAIKTSSLSSAIQLTSALYPEEGNSKNFAAMIAIVKEADVQMRNVFTAKDAAAWGGTFKIPASHVQNSVSLLKSAGGSLDSMVNRQKKLLESDRLSVKRVEMHINARNPEREKLLLLAGIGMPVMPDPKFIPNSTGNLPKLRRLYLEVAPAVNKMVYENFVEKGLAFVFPKQIFFDWVPESHINPFSWADNAGKIQGRNIADCSDGGREPGNSPLNSEHTKDESDALWGKIEHPTLTDIVQMILRFFRIALEEDPSVKWEDIIIWKMDLKGAYTLLYFKTEDVRLLCSEMTDEQIVVFICGVFGWTGTPAAFQVITRAILWELALVLRGFALMFVDDIIGVCLAKDLLQELSKTRAVCTNLLGTLSVEDRKTASARRLTVIGYDIDLDKLLATVSRKNLLRCIHGFLSVDLDALISVKLLQKLASWGSRYSYICSYLKLWVKALYREYAGRFNMVSFKISENARKAIRLFRVFFLLLAVREERFARRLSSFEPSKPKFVIEFDASLSGVGLIWYSITDAGVEVPVGGAAVDLLPLAFGTDASHQNTAEFIAALLGVRGLKLLGVDGPCPVLFRGDSISALSWVETMKFRSDLVGNAASVFVLQNILLEVEVVGTEHLPAEKNWRADGLSRDRSLRDIANMDPALLGVPSLNINASEILRLCDPRLHIDSDDDFALFWNRIKVCIYH
jgi:hypothetical protein